MGNGSKDSIITFIPMVITQTHFLIQVYVYPVGVLRNNFTHFLNVAFALNPSINEVVLLPLEPLWVHWEKRPTTLIDL